jgi:hypothetical protein
VADVDPLLALAMTIERNPGLFAVLTGSGVSQGAKIPTGRQVTHDLVRRLAMLEGKDVGEDPERWYRETRGKDPDYSTLLAAVARTAPERVGLLRGYFEPTEAEREQGDKTPTDAHRSIAELVAKGYVRIIVTPNFDRLQEQALREAGVEPYVISTEDAAHGAPPLAQMRCVVIKPNGDYQDPSIRNSPEELARYGPEMTALLGRVFDEYGLVVCGWSAKWDAALRNAIEAAPSRRYSMYWASPGPPSDIVAQLLVRRGAADNVIRIEDADTFFRDLADKVFAAADGLRASPLSVATAAQLVKRYLVDPRHKIALHDVVLAEAGRVVQALEGPHFPLDDKDTDGEALAKRLRLYEEATEVLVGMVVVGAAWSDKVANNEIAPWLRAIARVAQVHRTENPRLDIWDEMRYYPTTLLLYAGGLAATKSGNHAFLAQLLKVAVRDRDGNIRPLIDMALPAHVLDPDKGKRIQEYHNRYLPLNDHLAKVLREPLRPYLPDDADYDATFDRFEYLVSLAFADYSQRLGRLWVPGGRFAYKWRGVHIRPQQELDEEIGPPGARSQHWLTENGLFDGSLEHLKKVKGAVDEALKNRSIF